MLKATETPDTDPIPPECRATVERIQRALDGEVSADALGDPHAVVCAACQDRVRAARVLMSVLATPPEPVAVPVGFADRVLVAVAAERRAETRRAGKAGAERRVWPGGWCWPRRSSSACSTSLPDNTRRTTLLCRGRSKLLSRSKLRQLRTRSLAPTPDPAPAPRPIRIGDEFAKAEQAAPRRAEAAGRIGRRCAEALSTCSPTRSRAKARRRTRWPW